MWLACEWSYYFCIKSPSYVNKSDSFDPFLSLWFSSSLHNFSLLFYEEKPNLPNSDLKFNKVLQFASNL